MHRTKAQTAAHRYEAMEQQAVPWCHGDFATDFRGTIIWLSKSTPGAPVGAVPTAITFCPTAVFERKRPRAFKVISVPSPRKVNRLKKLREKKKKKKAAAH